jgi:hypothetical protein
MQNINKVIQAAKIEILQDLTSTVVPYRVTSFEELHDFVDANEYGLEEFGHQWGLNANDFDTLVEVMSEVQQHLDAWIKRGYVEEKK